MRKKQFYDSIEEIDTLHIELEGLEVDEREREHLSELIDANLHTTILDLILSELTEEDKKKFLDHLIEDDHDKIWKHLDKHIEGVQDKIEKAAKDLSVQLKKDIDDTKNGK